MAELTKVQRVERLEVLGVDVKEIQKRVQVLVEAQTVNTTKQDKDGKDVPHKIVPSGPHLVALVRKAITAEDIRPVEQFVENEIVALFS